jgi:ABC-type Fe3+/spermidine/putrescine transport system ATPase subunit
MQFELRHLQTTLGTTFIYVTHDQEEALALSDRLVVMHDGRIEQSGPPAEVYDSPRTLWVAGFVGSSNQLAGVVRSVGEQVEVDCDITRILADHAHDELRAGDRVVAVIRPDDVALSPASASGERVNRVEALVEDRINVGGQVRAVARTRGGIELVAQGPRASVFADGDLHPGQEIDLSWVPSAVHVYRN